MAVNLDEMLKITDAFNSLTFAECRYLGKDGFVCHAFGLENVDHPLRAGYDLEGNLVALCVYAGVPCVLTWDVLKEIMWQAVDSYAEEVR